MWSWSSKRPPPKRASIVPHQTSLTREGFGEVVVVNQSRFSNSGGHYGKRARLLKGSRVDELRILQLDQRLEGQTGDTPHRPRRARAASSRGPSPPGSGRSLHGGRTESG